jgi:hypothetical protein
MDRVQMDLRDRGRRGGDLLHYSLADKRAELATKDEDYNNDIVAFFAAALRDGQRDR